MINLKPEDLSDSLEAGGRWRLNKTYISPDGQLYAQQSMEREEKNTQQGEWLRYNLGVGGWSSVKQPPSGLKPLFK